MDRTPPCALEIEMSLIASCLFSHNSAVEISELVKPEQFYKTSHVKIMKSVVKIISASGSVDLPSVVNHMRDSGTLQGSGGAVYLAKLMDEPISTNHEAHCKIIREKYALRKLIVKSHETIERCYGTDDAENIIDTSQKEVGLIETGSTLVSAVPTVDIVHNVIDEIEKRQKSGGAITGLSTGFSGIDNILCGLNPGLIILAARPGMGKTALLMNIFTNIARTGDSTLVFSLEMDKSELTQRIIVSESRVNSYKVKTGNLNEQDWFRVTTAAGQISDLPILIDDSPESHYLEIRRRARRAKKQHNIKAVAVDYVQLVGADKGEKRHLDVGEISRSLKGMSRELNMPVIALAQLNRELEHRNNKRPLPSDLAESGKLENDADVIMFIYRDEVYNKKEDNPNKGKAEIIIAKHRHGDTGTVPLTWMGQYTRFENYAPETKIYDWGAP